MIFFLEESRILAFFEKSGAITTSVKILFISAAVFSVSLLLKATTPPKALISSHLKAFS